MIFNWSNFEEHTKHLLGQDIEPESITESPLGRAVLYRFDQPTGVGRMEYFDYSRDMRVMIFDCTWREAKDFHIKDGDWVRFNFSLSIDISMQLSKTKNVSPASPSWRVINNSPDEEVVESVPAGAKTIWLTICCKPALITQLTGRKIEDMPDLLKTAMTEDLYDSFYEFFDFTSRLNSITADVIRTSMTGGLRLAYVEARSVELLCLALNEIINSDGKQNKIKLSTSDKNGLEAARKILLGCYENPPTVAELGRQVGLNRNKLFYGFKAMYASTLSDFIQNQRLEKGKQLLLETDIPVIEIANRVGFKHQCDFSTAMKRHFGITPSQLRGS
ncbi:MAG: helix-turn-helix transcriptional regulator [Kordiimonadaceae bacterium]|nr:helix-turn-helix transcriptional regulator [Kordiimonadaceae bacterium]